ncbi:MAG: glycoside hydrolase family 3 N-terminal domain-containing protein [Thermodesulforhabdaceae bacterium]
MGFNGISWNDELRDLVEVYQVGGLVLFRRNVADSEQLFELISTIQQKALSKCGRKLFIAVDQEGGRVRRLPFLENPAPWRLAHDDQNSPEEKQMNVSRASSETARVLKLHGINVNLAPVLDLVLDKDSHFLGDRSFGSNASEVGLLGSLWIQFHRKHGVYSVAKHFPGLSHALLDPHEHGLTVLWDSPADMLSDLKPFEVAIRSRVLGIMISHGIYPLWDAKWPGTLSTVVCKEWLRKRLSFEGLILTDDLDMKAISAYYTPDVIAERTTLAGIDCLLVCNDMSHFQRIYDALARLVDTNLSIRQIHQESVSRIERLCHHLNL